jgi:hypothetical protein
MMVIVYPVNDSPFSSSFEDAIGQFSSCPGNAYTDPILAI